MKEVEDSIAAIHALNGRMRELADADDWDQLATVQGERDQALDGLLARLTQSEDVPVRIQAELARIADDNRRLLEWAERERQETMNELQTRRQGRKAHQAYEENK